jgi:hypothetical protein
MDVIMKNEKEKLLNINKNSKATKRFEPSQKYFTFADLLKLQRYLSDTYTNFDGGFGMFDESSASTELPEDITFGFVIEKERRFDRMLRKERGQEFDELHPFKWNERNCSERIHWLEMIIMLCDVKHIPFRFDPSIIDEIIAT